MNYTLSKYKYNYITKENVKQFNNRVIIYNDTLASSLDVTNIILSLDNEIIFYNSFQAMAKRFLNSKFINYEKQDQATLIYRWLQNFLRSNKDNKHINYVYSKVSLTNLIEVSLIYLDEILTLEE